MGKKKGNRAAGKSPAETSLSLPELAKRKLEGGEELTASELSSLDNKWLSSYVAKLIQRCAREMGKKPYEVIWLDFRDFIGFGYGKNSVGMAQKVLTRCGGFNVVRDAYFPPEAFPESEERSLLKKTAELNRKYASQEIYDNLFLQRLREVVDKAYRKRQIPAPNFRASAKGGHGKRVLSVLLSDLHYQSQIQLAETGVAYGAHEEARRTAKVCKTIAEYKMDYRAETRLNLYLAGDIIQNQLHDPRDGAPLAEQCAAAIHMLVQAITYLCSAFPEVEVFCTTGNHGRNTARHKSRAVCQKWDSIETIVYYGIKRSTESLKNLVGFHIPRTPWITPEVLGYKFFGSHGDSHFTPGNPGKSVPMERLENQSNKWNAALANTIEQATATGAAKYSVIMVGHVHTPVAIWLPNGTVLLINGALCPADGFTQNIGIPQSASGQWMWETVKGHPVGDLRLIVPGPEDDRDASLERIIKPFEDF